MGAVRDPILVALEAELPSVTAGDQNGVEDLCVRVGLLESNMSCELVLDSAYDALEADPMLPGTSVFKVSRSVRPPIACPDVGRSKVL